MQVTEKITAIAIPRFAQSVTLWLAATSMFCANMMQPDAVMSVRTSFRHSVSNRAQQERETLTCKTEQDCLGSENHRSQELWPFIDSFKVHFFSAASGEHAPEFQPDTETGEG